MKETINMLRQAASVIEATPAAVQVSDDHAARMLDMGAALRVSALCLEDFTTTRDAAAARRFGVKLDAVSGAACAVSRDLRDMGECGPEAVEVAHTLMMIAGVCRSAHASYRCYLEALLGRRQTREGRA